MKKTTKKATRVPARVMAAAWQRFCVILARDIAMDAETLAEFRPAVEAAAACAYRAANEQEEE